MWCAARTGRPRRCCCVPGRSCAEWTRCVPDAAPCPHVDWPAGRAISDRLWERISPTGERPSQCVPWVRPSNQPPRACQVLPRTRTITTGWARISPRQMASPTMTAHPDGGSSRPASLLGTAPGRGWGSVAMPMLRCGSGSTATPPCPDDDETARSLTLVTDQRGVETVPATNDEASWRSQITADEVSSRGQNTADGVPSRAPARTEPGGVNRPAPSECPREAGITRRPGLPFGIARPLHRPDRVVPRIGVAVSGSSGHGCLM